MIIRLRWTARIVGLLVVGLLMLFAVGEGFNPAMFTGFELGMLAALLMALAGMVLLWWREGIGGALTLGGMIAFFGLNLAATGKFPGGPVFPVCFLPGVLAVVCAFLGESHSASAGAHQPPGEQSSQHKIARRSHD